MAKRNKGVPAYPATHQHGIISIENLPKSNYIIGDLGIQIAFDGRIWVCIDGAAFIRFKPHTSNLEIIETKSQSKAK